MAQHKHLIKNMFLAASAGLIAAFPSGMDARSSMAHLSVSALVRPSTVFKFEGGSVELHVSALDVVRGYLDVPTYAHLTIVSGKNVRRVVNVTVDFEPHPDVFKSIQISARPGGNGNGYGNEKGNENGKGNGKGNGNGHEGGDVYYTSSTSLGYRLILAGKAKTGNFSLPLT
jgi:hypothetical protein